MSDEGISGRTTIVDIAKRAGVSTSAVSYALNGKPGVSQRTRDRILQIASELEWVPDAAARTLSLSRTDTVGLVLARDARFLASEGFFMEFIAGVETELSKTNRAMLLQVVSDPERELATYRRWRSELRVDGVVLVDLRRDDPRVELVQRIGLPAVAVADPSLTNGLMTVWTDDATGARGSVRHLHEMGHRSIARISGSPHLAHVAIRDAAFIDECEARGVRPLVLGGDFSGPTAEQLTREVLSMQGAPYTAIVYDSGLTAVAGLTAARQLGVSVPDDLNIIGWDDSPICTVTNPPISVMSYDVVSYGETVGRVFTALLDGAEPAAHVGGVPTLHRRGSTWSEPRPPAG